MSKGVFGGVRKTRCSEKFCKIYMKKLVPEPLLNNDNA